MRLNYSSENRYIRNNEDQRDPYNIVYIDILYTINNRITHQHTPRKENNKIILLSYPRDVMKR